MSDTPDFLARLYDLLKHDELRKALFIVLPMTALFGFWFGRYFPRYQIRALAPTCPPTHAELEAQVEELKSLVAAGPEAVSRARGAVSSSGRGLWLAIQPKVPDNYHVLKSSIP